MATDLFVSNELRLFLIAQGIGINPTDHDSAIGTTTAIFENPRDGVPEPRWSDALGGYQEDATLTIIDMDVAGPAGAVEAYEEETFVQIVVRSRGEAAGKLIHRQVRGLIHPIGAHKGHTLWTMNDLLVQLSTIWRGERPAGATPVSYTRTAAYRFCCRRKSLAGLPYTP